jgi:hypothetical protein
MAHLGAECEHWEYLDCIYRRHPGTDAFLYPGEAALFGEVRREDLALIDELAARLATSWPAGEAALFAPLAAGHHVDHQILFRVAVGLRHCGFDVRFYEDYPYADDQQVLEAALQRWCSRPAPVVQPLTGEDLNARITSICCYRSQLEVLFGGETSVASRIETYALGVGGREGYAERYWTGGTSQWLRNG